MNYSLSPLIMQLDLSMGDFVIIGFYILCVGVIATWHMRVKNDIADFLVAGRRLTLPILIATLVATWYGGIFGISEFTGLYGLGTWLIQGIVWYVAYLFFALFLAARIRRLSFYTVADILADRYNDKVAFVGGIFTYLMTNAAPYILSLGLVVQILFGISLTNAILLSAFFIIFYTMVGGFRGVVYADVIHFITMYVAFSCLTAVAIWKFGGIDFLQANLTLVPGYSHHLTLTGGMSLSYILVWGGLACWIFVDPNFYQICYAAHSPQTARNGIMISILCWMVFDILSCGSALYAFAAQNAGKCIIPDSKTAHIVLANLILPCPLKGLFLAGIMATIMSTADSFLFAGAMNISRDYYWRFVNRHASQKQMIAVTRWTIILTGVLAALLAILLPSVKDLWYTIGTIGLAGLLVPTLISFCPTCRSSTAALISMMSGAGISLVWLLFGKSPTGDYWLGLQPLYPGLAVALFQYSITGLFMGLGSYRK